MTDEGVLGNLPSSRPGKRSAKRDRPAKAGSARPERKPRRTAAVKDGRIEDEVAVDRTSSGEVERDPAPPAGDPLRAAVRTAAGLAIGGAKAAGAVTQELFRRLPKP